MEYPAISRGIKYYIIHCAYTKADQDFDVEDIRRWHKAKGWMDIGYNRFVKRDGTLQEGRDLRHWGAHTLGHNHDSIGVCYAGGKSDDGKPEDNITPGQFNSIIKDFMKWQEVYPDLVMAGHNQFNVRACPCFDVREYAAKHGMPYFEGELKVKL